MPLVARDSDIQAPQLQPQLQLQLQLQLQPQVFEDMLADTNLPEMLVEPMLASWLLASGFQGSSTAIRAAVSLSQQVVAVAETVSVHASPRNSLGDDDDAALVDEDEDEEAAAESRHRVRTLASIRALQVPRSPIRERNRVRHPYSPAPPIRTLRQ